MDLQKLNLLYRDVSFSFFYFWNCQCLLPKCKQLEDNIEKKIGRKNVVFEAFKVINLCERNKFAKCNKCFLFRGQIQFNIFIYGEKYKTYAKLGNILFQNFFQ